MLRIVLCTICAVIDPQTFTVLLMHAVFRESLGKNIAVPAARGSSACRLVVRKAGRGEEQQYKELRCKDVSMYHTFLSPK